MRVLNLLLLFIGASTALVYHPSSLLQHRGTHVLLSSEADEAEAEEPVAADPPAPAATAAAPDGTAPVGKVNSSIWRPLSGGLSPKKYFCILIQTLRRQISMY